MSPQIKRINHLTAERVQQPKRKPSGSDEEIARYNSLAWRTLRDSIIRREPLCRECKRKGLITQATVVDHIERARANPERFYDESNLQPLCSRCHNRKSAKESHEK